MLDSTNDDGEFPRRAASLPKLPRLKSSRWRTAALSSSPAARPPSGPEWMHEIKHDGFRLMAWRDGDGVRLLTRRGNDWIAFRIEASMACPRV